jgi:hypothetical protein
MSSFILMNCISFDTRNRDESQNNNPGWKSQMQMNIQNCRKCELTHSDRKQISGCLGLGKAGEVTKKTLE